MMIEKINKEIEVINSNIEILPKKNKKSIKKYVDYLGTCINRYNFIYDNVYEEIKSRFDSRKNKYDSISYSLVDTKINYNSIKLSDNRVRNSEKLNLDYLFYNLHNSSSNLDEVNNTINSIINNFSKVGISITEDDFVFSENAKAYIHTLLKDKDNIQNVFNDIYFKSPDILKQIELNFEYIYYTNEKKINECFKGQYSNYDYDKFISDHRSNVFNNEKIKHENAKYLFDLFYEKKYDINEFLNDNRMTELISGFVLDENNPNNYDNLINLRKSLNEYKCFKKYDFFINDIKSLFEHKDEYKGQFANKYKEIEKKEKQVFSINKKMNKTGLFKLSKSKLTDLKIEKIKLFGELVADYDELNSLKIKDTIFNYITPETNYYDIFKFVTYDFNYIVAILKNQNAEIKLDEIKDIITEIQMLIYDNSVDFLNNIKISDNLEIDKIICEKYKLNSVNITPEQLVIDEIDKVIINVDKVILHYDLKKSIVDLNEIKFLLDTDDIVKKID